MPAPPSRPRIPLAALVFLLVLLSPALPSGARADEHPASRKLEIMALLKDRDFTGIEQRLAGPTTDWSDYKAIFNYSGPTIEPALNAWVEAHPDSPAPFMARGAYYVHSGLLERGTKSASETHREQFAGMVRYMLKATRDYVAALKLDPGIGSAYAQLGYISFALGDNDGAERLRGAGMVNAPDSPEIYRRYMFQLQPKWGGSWEALYGYVTNLQARHGDDPRFAFLAGYIEAILAYELYASGDYDAALSYIEKATAAYQMPERLYTKALVLVALKRPGDGLETIDKAIALDPDNPSYYEFRSRLRYRQGKTTPALQDAERAMELDPYDPQKLLVRAWYLRRMAGDIPGDGDPVAREKLLQQAGKDLENALFHGAFNANVHEALGNFHVEVSGDTTLAMIHFERSIELMPGEAAYWIPVLKLLFAQKDCRALDAAKIYLKTCAANRSCEPEMTTVNAIQREFSYCATPNVADGVPMPLAPDTRERVSKLRRCAGLFESHDDTTAMEACMSLARKGDPVAQFDIGSLYMNGGMRAAQGGGEAAHFAQGILWLSRAADNGYTNAVTFLAQAHMYGLGVPRDPAQGLALLRQAAQQNNIMSMLLLGRAYWRGANTDQDIQQAEAYLQKAKRMGSEEAADTLRRLLDDQGEEVSLGIGGH